MQWSADLRIEESPSGLSHLEVAVAAIPREVALRKSRREISPHAIRRRHRYIVLDVQVEILQTHTSAANVPNERLAVKSKVASKVAKRNLL